MDTLSLFSPKEVEDAKVRVAQLLESLAGGGDPVLAEIVRAGYEYARRNTLTDHVRGLIGPDLRHETVPVRDRMGQSIPIDRRIAPLISALWDMGIRTYNSCEDNIPAGYVWIHFATAEDALMFLRAVTRDVDQKDHLYRRIMGEDPEWIYSPIVMDRNVINAPIGYEPVYLGNPDPTFSMSVRFPATDLETILERMARMKTDAKVEKTAQDPRSEDLAPPPRHVVIRYAEGGIREEYDMVGEMKHGPFTLYQTNGNKKEEGTFERDHKQGVWTEFYETGEKCATWTYVNGSLHGTYNRYFKNGFLSHSAEYKHGELDGRMQVLNAFGTRICDCTYRKGKLHGKYTRFAVFEKDTVIEEHDYVDGVRDGIYSRDYWSSPEIITEVAQVAEVGASKN